MYILVFAFLSSIPTSVVGSTCTSSVRRAFNAKDCLKERVFEDQRMLKTTRVDNDPQCFQECSKDCRCLSFNVCGQSCQLNAGNRFLAKNSLKSRSGCRYYDMPQPKSNCGLMSNKSPGVCCARLSPPCFNGGTCYVNITDITRRYQCECPHGYYGNQCEIKNPKSCSDYWTNKIKPISREYTIEDVSGTPYKTFCDFDSEDGLAWTLVQSFKPQNEGKVNYPFTIDLPLNDDVWNLFRLPKIIIEGVRSRSKYWRGTCSYQEYGIDYRDYVRVLMSQADPLNLGFKPCSLVDFIDIKGTSCTNCTTTIYLLEEDMLHIGPYFGHLFEGCTFDSSDADYLCAGPNQPARLLGLYSLCSDPDSRCTQTQLSTTQIWFGEEKPQGV